MPNISRDRSASRPTPPKPSTIPTYTLLFIAGFYCAFVGIERGLIQTCNAFGAFDISDAACVQGLETLKKQDPMLVHGLAMIVRVEGALWLGMGFAAATSILVPSLRPGVLLAAAASTLVAAAVHAHHMGLMGATPFHATDHKVNGVLLAVDGFVGVMSLVSLGISVSEARKLKQY